VFQECESMRPTELFETTLAREYASLSARLREAADYVAENPVEIATRSLRSVASRSGLPPATFSRLARALGFGCYEELRELSRAAVGRSLSSFSHKVEQLQAEERRNTLPPLLLRQSEACIENIVNMSQSLDRDKLEQAVDRLHKARNVVLVGALGSAGVVEYMAYMANFFSTKWRIAAQKGASMGSVLADFGPGDVLLVITKPPFARCSIRAAQMAARQGAFVIVLTDTRACDALEHADIGFVVPSESPQFFSSFAATLVLTETIIGMVVARGGARARRRIAQVEEHNRQLEEI